MNIKNIFQTILKKTDFVGKQVGFLYNGDKRIKSTIVCVMTLIIIAFSIYCFIYYGEDLMYKQKPISRMSKDNNVTDMNLEDIPYVLIFVTNKAVVITNPERYFEMVPKVYENTYDEVNKKPSSNVLLLDYQKCNENSFGKYKSLFMDKSYAVPWNEGFCITQNKYKLADGTLKDYNLTIYNSYGAIPGNFHSNPIRPCRNNTLTGKVCATPAEIDKVIFDLLIGVYALDSYIDLLDYENPQKYTITNVMQPIMKGFTKQTYFRMKNTFIITDTGLILEDNQTPQKFPQIDNIYTDINILDDYVMITYFEGMKINDVYYRRYVKVQDLLASVGGLIKLLFMVASLLMNNISENQMIIDMSNDLFRLCQFDKNKEMGSIKNNNSLDYNSFNQIREGIKVDNFTKPSNVLIENFNLT
jgi:hypothetical protein